MYIRFICREKELIQAFYVHIKKIKKKIIINNKIKYYK